MFGTFIERGKKHLRVRLYNGFLNVGTSKRPDGIEGTPICDHKDFDAVSQRPIEHGHAAITFLLLQLGQNTAP